MSVLLVGAGPGDPGLLTLKGAEALARAEVVVHDRLVDPAVLALAAPGAELVDVGKRMGDDADGAQQAINDLLIDRARAGQSVVRLKGGDPYLFGRGGEEALALEAAGVAYEVVPGVSAALAVPALAGFPVTHRGLSSAVVVLSGHDPGKERAAAPDWEALAGSSATLVVLMGAARCAQLAERLLGLGRSATTPVAVIERGSTPHQRTVRTTLGELGGCVVESPATIVVGEVARLALASLEQRPLFSRQVIVTRATEQDAGTVAALRDRGATVLECPTLAFAEASDGGAALRAAAGRLRSYSWVVCTSANAVTRLFAELSDARAFGSAKVAAVGRITADALAARGVVADLVPLRSRAEGLLEVFPRPIPGEGRRLLLPRSALGGAALPEGLAALGWEVEVVEAYRTLRAEPRFDPAVLADADAVTFASGSAVAGFLELFGADHLPPVVATIGPSTSAVARAAGIEVTVESPEPSPEVLADALAGHFARSGPVRSRHG